jgi:hypothetical protein
MAAPRTTSLRLKLRTTGEEVDAEIKLLPPIQILEILRKAGIKTAGELFKLGDVPDLKIMSIVEQTCVEAVSVAERWTVDELRNTFDIQELMKIYLAVVESVTGGKTSATTVAPPESRTYG